jgi:hypothetical protein
MVVLSEQQSYHGRTAIAKSLGNNPSLLAFPWFIWSGFAAQSESF